MQGGRTFRVAFVLIFGIGGGFYIWKPELERQFQNRLEKAAKSESKGLKLPNSNSIIQCLANIRLNMVGGNAKPGHLFIASAIGAFVGWFVVEPFFAKKSTDKKNSNKILRRKLCMAPNQPPSSS